jgi:hypothetical protein
LRLNNPNLRLTHVCFAFACISVTTGSCVCDPCHVLASNGTCVPQSCPSCQNGGVCKCNAASNSMVCSCLGHFTGATCSGCACVHGSCNSITGLCDCPVGSCVIEKLRLEAEAYSSRSSASVISANWCKSVGFSSAIDWSGGSHIMSSSMNDTSSSWVEYTASFAYTGTYSLDITLANYGTPRALQVYFDGVLISSMQTTTSSWCATSAVTIRSSVDLPVSTTGSHKLRLVAPYGWPFVDYILMKHVCVPQYVGSLCQFTCSRGSYCSEHGECIWDNANCVCDTDFIGSGDNQCSFFCPTNYCNSHGTCSYATGECICDANFYGPRCDNNVVPTISSLSPSTLLITESNLIVYVNGTDFVPSSNLTCRLGPEPYTYVQAIFLSTTRAQCIVPATGLPRSSSLSVGIPSAGYSNNTLQLEFVDQTISGSSLNLQSTGVDPEVVTVGDPITLQLSAQTGSNIQYVVDFGDDSLQLITTNETLVHSFTKVGTYTITAEYTNSQGGSVISQEVVVQEQPVRGLSAAIDQSISGLVSFTPTTLSGSNLDLHYDFGDGDSYDQHFSDSASLSSQSHVFLYADTYM